ncbi:hypothetical protein [Streptomyces bluensis]|uniref:Uncharacterized protein n=1 Tax=Streptomyces bluensis TaxID=33897 RepID=A0ABW6UV02_9ACTN
MNGITPTSVTSEHQMRPRRDEAAPIDTAPGRHVNAPWIIRYEGPGYCLSEAGTTEADTYQRARTQAKAAEAGHALDVTLRIGGQHALLPDVGRIWILRLDETTRNYEPHSRSWFDTEPSPRALTPLPDDF